ncbi:MAG TPA: substrate-binding domain-containing protein [Methanospirillum sp.]|jgi:tungstate transport system substrate-binding protein|nr:substrate-binding domain-containing protein [Methanospirillum sp.]OQB39026.1 MAG: PBP superfamily domain protein [Euryarchaeota archaeon ADurb.Bin165]HPY59831.1 substrate-binding domain-containing protein [Methanospirillum sp.]HQB99012.1 substrate-binding domain-containing protein [Methanospirillum sp.]
MIGKFSIGIIALVLGAMLLCGAVSADRVDTLGEHGADRLLIATTTSLDATKLLDLLEEKFKEETGVTVEHVAVGTGMALEIARNCDADIVMVHDRVAEDKFIDEGFGVDRRVFGYNYFLLVGPENDPAKVAGLNGTAAFIAIEKAAAEDPSVVFVSRGDQSGTHSREKLLWKWGGYDYAEINTSDWYRDAGSGMGQTLTMTEELQGYTLSDSATWGTYESELTLVPLVENDENFQNVYAVMRVNDEKCPDVNTEIAKKWINFMISDEVQDILQTYGTEKTGVPYFNPGRGQAEVMGVTVEETADPVV